MTSFSILMPSYNYGRFINEAIESVINQPTTSPLEIIIQDGLSTDNTADILEGYRDEPRIKFKTGSDIGQSDALNKALARATGSIIGWLNADEFYLPGALDFIEKAAADHPECDVFVADCLFVDQRGKYIRTRPAHRLSEFALRNYGCFISSCATFVRRSALSDAPWDTTLRRSMDWDLWLNLANRSSFYYAPRPLAAFRVHPGQVTNTPEADDYEEFERLARKHGIVSTHGKAMAANAVHKYLKATNGAYIRQIINHAKYRNRYLQWWPPLHSIAP